MTRIVEFVTGHETPLAAGQTDRKIVHLVNHFSVDLQVPVRDEQASLIIAHLDLGLNRHALVRRDDLTAIRPAVALARSPATRIR